MAISRILEPEVMDTIEDARDYDLMDHSHVNRLFVADLLAAGPLEGDVLDLGTGTALIPIELCGQCEDCRVMATDAAGSMLDLARYNIEVRSLTGRIQLALVDAKQLPYRAGQFAVVMSNSLVHHVPEPLAVLREAVRVTVPGGRLFFRDLFRPESRDALQGLVEQYAGGESAHGREMFAASLHAALTVDEVQQLVGKLGFSLDTVRATSDRHWTWSACKLV